MQVAEPEHSQQALSTQDVAGHPGIATHSILKTTLGAYGHNPHFTDGKAQGHPIALLDHIYGQKPKQKENKQITGVTFPKVLTKNKFTAIACEP